MRYRPSEETTENYYQFHFNYCPLLDVDTEVLATITKLGAGYIAPTNITNAIAIAISP